MYYFFWSVYFTSIFFRKAVALSMQSGGSHETVSPRAVNHELKRDIELLLLNIRNLRKTHDADKLQIASKKKRLEDLHRVFDELQRYKHNLVIKSTESKRPSGKNGSPSSGGINLLGKISSDEENLDELREAIRLIRRENQGLASQVVKNDALIRLGPHVGTLALRVKRTIDGRRYTDLQRREAEARQEVNILSFHLRNEQSRLHQARMQSVVTVKPEAKKNRDDTMPTAQVTALLSNRLKGSRGRLAVLARQRNDAAREEEQLNTKIRKLQEMLKNPRR